jgi:hypothetical protein
MLWHGAPPTRRVGGGTIPQHMKTSKLLETIRTLLQAFPESVIIESLDRKTGNRVIKFVNNVAKDKILNTNLNLNDMSVNDIDISVQDKPINFDSYSESEFGIHEHDHDVSFANFVEKQS